jgi:hypothetical protein
MFLLLLLCYYFGGCADRRWLYSLQYPKNGAIGATTLGTWWGKPYTFINSPEDRFLTFVYSGNTVFTNNADALGTPMKTVAPGETFGPTRW